MKKEGKAGLCRIQRDENWGWGNGGENLKKGVFEKQGKGDEAPPICVGAHCATTAVTSPSVGLEKVED